jgi:hypothetical protein
VYGTDLILLVLLQICMKNVLEIKGMSALYAGQIHLVVRDSSTQIITIRLLNQEASYAITAMLD